MAVARIEWPDWGACFLNDEAPLAALAAAIEERAAVVPAQNYRPGNSHWWDDISVSGLGSLLLGTPAPTVGSRLALLRAAIQSLAPAFIDLDAAAAAWAWGQNAPFPFLGAPRGSLELPYSSVVEGEHSLAAFSPGIGALEAHEPTLAGYRKFLADCAWWLERFRYVQADLSSVFMRRIEEDSDGRHAEYDVSAPVCSQIRRQVVRTCFHSTEYRLSRLDGEDTERWEAIQYAKLRIANPAPLDAAAVLLCRHTGGEVDNLERTLSITLDGSTVRNVRGEHVVRSRVAGKTVQTLREDISYTSDDSGVSRSTEWTKTAWSADGALWADTRGADASGNPNQRPYASRTYNEPARIAPLDFAEPWTRLSRTVRIPARGAAVLFDELTACPTPSDMSSWGALLPDSPAIRPNLSKQQFLTVYASAWLEVLLDYNDSFRYRADNPEEE